MRPAGAVALVEPKPGNVIGQMIATHEGEPHSHAIMAHGNGNIIDSTSPWTRITTESYWADHKLVWYEPIVPFSPDEARLLKSISYMIRDRIAYGYTNLVEFAFKGAPKERGHFLFCTYLVAEMYMAIRDYDISGTEEPWKVGIRKLALALRDSGNFRRIVDAKALA